MFGDSFVYILFDDATDLYWARSRVLEYLSQVRDRLPAGVNPALGPDATGLGWIYQYALVDRTGQHDLAQLRALQDWFLKFELKTLANVADQRLLERGWVVHRLLRVCGHYHPTDRTKRAIRVGQRVGHDGGGQVRGELPHRFSVGNAPHDDDLQARRMLPVPKVFENEAREDELSLTL